MLMSVARAFAFILISARGRIRLGVSGARSQRDIKLMRHGGLLVQLAETKSHVTSPFQVILLQGRPELRRSLRWGRV